MKMMLNIICFGLIAGILSSTIADEVPTHMHMLGYVNTTIADIEEFDTKLCEKHGGDYNDYKKQQENFETCVRDVQTEIIHELLTDATLVRPKAEDYYKKYCGKLPKFEICVKNITDTIKNCLDVSKHESADIFYNTFSEVMQFICDHDGIRIGMFINSGGDECLHSKQPDLTHCANHTFGQYIKETVTNGAEVGGLGKFHLLVPDEKKCSVFDKFRVCALDQLKGCSDRTTADIAASVFQITNKVTTCNRWIKSKASLANVGNILLMTAVTAFMSFQFV